MTQADVSFVRSVDELAASLKQNVENASTSPQVREFVAELTEALALGKLTISEVRAIYDAVLLKRRKPTASGEYWMAVQDILAAAFRALSDREERETIRRGLNRIEAKLLLVLHARPRSSADLSEMLREEVRGTSRLVTDHLGKFERLGCVRPEESSIVPRQLTAKGHRIAREIAESLKVGE